jgi:GMP synthase (glutamine-hydrolysing)
MYEGKGDVFDVVSVHTDHVVTLPEGGRVLASNDMSEVQSLEIEGQGSVCWGVQYHPEFDLGSIADILEDYGPATVRVGIFPDMETVERLKRDMRAVSEDGSRMDLRRLYGWGEEIADSSLRMRELKNWLDRVVKPQA